MSFHVWEPMPGVYHIRDAMGVWMTLLAGSDRALLFDTGYGLEDVSAFVSSLTKLPLQVVLSHAHHDHVMGARFFPSVSILKAEQETAREYTGEKWRRKVLSQAVTAGIDVCTEEYLHADMPEFVSMREQSMQLGGLTAQIIACPGHTPGSAVIYVPERELLLTGDDWNPCTWLFFPEALGAVQYRENISKLLDLPFRHILCPHSDRLCTREELQAFVHALSDDALLGAPSCPEGDAMGIHTAQITVPGGNRFVYDRRKVSTGFGETWLRALPAPDLDRAGSPYETAQAESDLFCRLHPEEPRIELAPDDLPEDCYEITCTSQKTLIRGGKSGILYGTYAYLQARICGEEPASNLQKPSYGLRMLDAWDNMDGSIERGYAGRSLWFEGNSFCYDVRRIRQLGRMLASTGINVLCINNVNVHEPAQSLTDELLTDAAEFAKILRPFGVRLMFSIDFSMPLRSGLQSADPLDDKVRAWWTNCADRIYQEIPDFAGFLVKADSEHRPGPHTYGRTHAEGANMLADALRPHGGVVVWRAFVYNCLQDWRDTKTDRPCAAYELYQPMDGEFSDNVILQIKYGPFDFQVREPVSPLLLSMNKTNLCCELQLTQEYTGHQIDLFAMPGMWREIFDQIGEGQLSAVSAVSNLGRDRNWTGHPFAALNLYAFGQFAWNWNADPQQVIRDWIRLSYAMPVPDEEKLLQILLLSRDVYEQYTAPLGLCWMVQPHEHYGPSPWGYEFQAWGTYNRADRNAVGTDRTRNGTGYASQYPPALEKLYSDPETCPDRLLLFFHRLPYSYVMRDSRTLIQRIYDDHFEGYRKALEMREKLRELPLPDADRQEALSRMDLQVENAREWRDVVNTFFLRLSGIPDGEGRFPAV